MKISQQVFFEAPLIHTFEYYDRPLIYVTQSKEGRLLLRYLIDDETGTNLELVFCAELTPEELQGILASTTEIKGFLETKIANGQMYYARVDYNIPAVRFELITRANFDPETLPSERFYVEYDYKNRCWTKDLTSKGE